MKIAALGKGKDGYTEKKSASFATDSTEKRKKNGSFLNRLFKFEFWKKSE